MAVSSAYISKLVTLLLSIGYGILMIRYHDWAQQFVISVQKEPAWTWAALGGLILILTSLAVIFARNWQRHANPERNRLLLFQWMITAVLIGLAQWLLVSVHTEAIHYLQYGILTGLVFMVVRRIPATLIITIMVGIIDEAYQYWFLYSAWPVYYDVNDVILNALAGGLMLLFLLSAFPQWFSDGSSDPWMVRNVDLLALATFLLALVIGIGTGFLSLYRFPLEQSEGALLILNRNAPSSQFWYHAWWSGRYYHQMSFTHGVIALVLIAEYYRFSLPTLLLKKTA